MDKEVREISRFFVAMPRGFLLSVWRVSQTSLTTITSTLLIGVEFWVGVWLRGAQTAGANTA